MPNIQFSWVRMHFHNPIDCVIYSVAVNFIVTMDDISDTVYKAARDPRRTGDA